MARRDPDAMVRSFALGAVEMHLHNTRIAVLLAELSSARESDAWSLIQVVLDSATPLLLTYEDDPLWLGRALSAKPPALLLYAQQRVDEEIKELARKSDDVFAPYYR